MFRHVLNHGFRSVDFSPRVWAKAHTPKSLLQDGLPFLTIGEEFLASDEFFNKAAGNK